MFVFEVVDYKSEYKIYNFKITANLTVQILQKSKQKFANSKWQSKSYENHFVRLKINSFAFKKSSVILNKIAAHSNKHIKFDNFLTWKGQ